MIKKEKFGACNGKEVTLYSIQNEKGMKAEVMNYGAVLVRLMVPNKNGKLEDVVLGYDNLEQYFVNGCFFGSTIGPNANRIANAKFSIQGAEYLLDVNDGANNLHSHRENGYHKRMWDAKENGNSVTFTLEDDASMGFPGKKKCSVTYTLTEDNRLELSYHITADKETIINPTNHTYFNLEGHNGGTILDHEMKLYASRYTPVVPGAIPTGKLEAVTGTPMDFTEGHKIGERIDADFEQLSLTGGYDHNWVLDGEAGTLRLIAEVKAPKSGRHMKVYTDLPGVQFYAGNYIEREDGKEGAVYLKRMGFCLETQYYPDTANRPEFPSAQYGPNKDYRSTTIYEFV